MTTKTNPPTHALLIATSILSLAAAACGGGLSEVSVDDGVVTEVHELVTAEDLGHLRVTLQYPEARLIAGGIAHVDVALVPVAPARPGANLGPAVARPEHVKRMPGDRTAPIPETSDAPTVTPEVTPRDGATRPVPRVDFYDATIPAIAPEATVPEAGKAGMKRSDLERRCKPPSKNTMIHSRPPAWMNVTVEGEAAERYEVLLVKIEDGTDDRVNPKVIESR